MTPIFNSSKFSSTHANAWSALASIPPRTTIEPSTTQTTAGASASSATSSSKSREWGGEASDLRGEIKINGEVVGRIYNGGGVELADEYGYLAKQLGWGTLKEGNLVGPELADVRATQLLDALKSSGAEYVQSATAISQQQWLAGLSDIVGTRFDRLA